MSNANEKSERTVAVVLAGGVGVRLGLNIPKQLVKIAGKPVIEHTIEALNASADIDEIIVMMTPGHLDALRPIFAGGKYAKLTDLYEGGETRNETSRRAAEILAEKGDDNLKVLFHDAVRPFIDGRILKDCVDALDTYGSVDVAIPSADTLIEVSEDNIIVGVPKRSTMRRGQTPQGFRLHVIREAYDLAVQDPDFQATDDCSVVLKYTPDVKIAVVLGADENMKVTEPIDVSIADKLFQLRSGPRFSYDDEERASALEGKTLVVFGGSYGIGQEICEMAKSFGANVFSFSRSETNTHVQSRVEVREALQEVAKASGRIDYVVNCAGVLTISRLEDASDDTIFSALDVNMVGPIVIAQESFPYLQASKGQMLNFTSSSYTRGRSEYSLYSATKAAIVNFTQALADEWAENGVRVNCINPERTATPMRVQAFGEEPPGTLLAAEAVALESIDTLISPTTTGQVIDVRRQGS